MSRQGSQDADLEDWNETATNHQALEEARMDYPTSGGSMGLPTP